MATPPLISKSDFAGFIDISANLSNTKLDPCIRQAQDFDLRQLMGDKFYWDMINNYNSSVSDPKVFTAPYLALFNGVTYDLGEVPVSYEGLKPVLVYFAGARLVKGLDMHITPNAIMQKRNEFSDHSELKEKTFTAIQYENSAIAYWNMAKTYLDNSGTTFTYWNNGCGCEVRSQYKPKMVAVGGKNDYENRGYGIRRR